MTSIVAHDLATTYSFVSHTSAGFKLACILTITKEDGVPRNPNIYPLIVITIHRNGGSEIFDLNCSDLPKLKAYRAGSRRIISSTNKPMKRSIRRAIGRLPFESSYSNHQEAIPGLQTACKTVSSAFESQTILTALNQLVPWSYPSPHIDCNPNALIPSSQRVGKRWKTHIIPCNQIKHMHIKVAIIIVLSNIDKASNCMNWRNRIQPFLEISIWACIMHS